MILLPMGCTIVQLGVSENGCHTVGLRLEVEKGAVGEERTGTGNLTVTPLQKKPVERFSN
jgi:hypothetical protein